METDWDAINDKKFKEMAIFAAQKNAIALIGTGVKLDVRQVNVLSRELYIQLVEARKLI